MSESGNMVALGWKFKLFGYRIRIWKYGWEYQKGLCGRYFFFWWHPRRFK
jgi:hypothetical protein